MRLFVGLALPPPVIEELSLLSVRLRSSDDGLRWSSPDSWHITLEFLGVLNEQQSGCVRRSLEKLPARPTPVIMEGTGFFERVGIFFASVALTPELASLQRAVTSATSLCGFAPETRPYYPHVTLARTRGKAGVKGLQALQSLPGLTSKGASAMRRFTATEVLLFESVPHPAGARYEVRARFPLTD